MKALVAGYGRMGGFHAKVLRDLGFEVTTVDPDASRRADHLSLDDALQDAHDPSWRCPSWRLADRSTFDVAVVATPPQQLRDTAYQLAGVPRLLVEKPFALNLAEARMLAAYLHEQGSKVCVGLIERFNPQARALRALLRDGTLKGVTQLHFTRWNDRPSFDLDLDLKLHDVDLAAFLRAAAEVTFDTAANSHRRVRTIEVTHADGVLIVDLMDHQLSPLHGMWHAFLTDGTYPTPADVINALWSLEQSSKPEREPMAVAA